MADLACLCPKLDIHLTAPSGRGILESSLRNRYPVCRVDLNTQVLRVSVEATAFDVYVQRYRHHDHVVSRFELGGQVLAGDYQVSRGAEFESWRFPNRGLKTHAKHIPSFYSNQFLAVAGKFGCAGP